MFIALHHHLTTYFVIRLLYVNTKCFHLFFQVIWITQWCPVLGFHLSISNTAIQVKEETMQYVYQRAKSFSRSLWTSVSPHQLTSNLWINKFPKKKQNNTVSYLMLFFNGLMIFAYIGLRFGLSSISYLTVMQVCCSWL